MSETTPGQPAVVDARPVVMARIGWICAAVVVLVFSVTALVMRTDNAGAHFGPKDQWGTFVLGIVLGGLFVMATRPRLHADLDGVRLRAFLGGWRTVPWELVVGVEFPAKVRFARLVLPGDETLAIYAIQRLDKDRAVTAMRGLRALFAATHPGVR
jgi:hypothetical protein